MTRINFEVVMMLTVLALVACSERIIYRDVSVPVPVLPELPEVLMQDYPGRFPIASAEGEVCFSGENVKSLQEWMLFHKQSRDQLIMILKENQ